MKTFFWRWAAPAAFSMFLCFSPTGAETWTGGTGDWFDGDNWNADVPTSGTAAIINNDGTAQISAGDAETSAFQLGQSDGTSGYLQILNGGTLTAGSTSRIALHSNAIGGVIVDGAGSTLNVDGHLVVGGAGTASLSITNGGQVQITNALYADEDGGVATILVSGEDSLLAVTSFATLARGGEGTMTIADGGQVSVNGTFYLTETNGVQGTLNIGDGAGAGILNTSSLTTNANTPGTVNFNHTDEDYWFTRTGAQGGSNVAINGNAEVIHLGSGQTTLIGSHSYTRATEVHYGTLRLNGAAINNTSDITVGLDNGHDGRVELVDGASFASLDDVVIGSAAGATGYVLVDNSLLDADDELVVGSAGTGTLTIVNGGVVRCGSSRHRG